MKLKKNAYNQYPEFDIDDPIPILKKYKQSSYFLQVEERSGWYYLPFTFNGKTSAAIIHGTALY